jgi:DNA polymerase-3 subunit gamma/tau
MERLCAEWIGYVRNVMVLKSVPDGGDLIIAAPEEMAQLQTLARAMELPAILHMMDVLQTALERLRGGVSRRVEMEMAVLKLCDPALDNTQAALLARIGELEKAVRSGVVPASSVQVERPHTDVLSAPSAPIEPPCANVAGDGAPVAPSIPEQAKAAPSNDAPAPAQPVSDEEIPFAKWGEVLETLLTSCPPLYGVLAQSQAVQKGEMLLICTDNALFKELLAQDNNKKMLAEAIRQVAGKSYRLGLRRAVAVQKEKNDPLSQLLTAARKAEVPVNEN